MFSVEVKRKIDINFRRFERLLFHVSRLVNISIEIKNPEGKTIICAPENSGGVNCNKQGKEQRSCCAETTDMFQEIVESGRTAVQKCRYNIDIIGIPLKRNQELAGILFACKKTDNVNMNNPTIEFLEEIADRITSEIQAQFEIDNVAQELSDKYEELRLIYDIGRELGGISTVKEAIRFIVEESMETLNANMVLASIPGKDIQETSYDYPLPLPIDINDQSLMEKIDKVITKRFTSGDTHPAQIVFRNVCEDMELSDLFDAPMGMLAAPVKLKGVVSGFLCVINFNMKKSFQTGDVRLASSLAEQISLAVTNKELLQNLKDFLLNAIKTLVYSIEAKDAYTKGHSERVRNITMMIAENLDISPEDMEALNWAAILHDIGKIGVPEGILTKPEKLSEEEFLHIKKHPEKGYAILMPIEQLKESFKGIHHHHEKFDGTGYPSGLKGLEIPLFARIIAVADTYDAMTSDRAYRARISHEDAIAEIDRVKGKQLDPGIAEIFIKLFESQSAVRDRF